MNISRKLAISGLIVVAVFAFGFGLAFVGEAQAGPDPCCTIEASGNCTAGVGTWYEGACIIYYVPGDDHFCQNQVSPDCW